LRRQQLLYILSCFVFGTIGFSIVMAFDFENGLSNSNIKGETLEAFYFQSKGVEKKTLGSGWSRPEWWGTWSDGPKSTLAIDLYEPSRGDLELEFVIKPFFAGGNQSQPVELSVNGTKMVTWKLLPSKKWGTQRVRIPKNIWEAKRPAEISFAYSEPQSPAKLGIGKDTRRLAIGLKTLTIRDLI